MHDPSSADAGFLAGFELDPAFPRELALKIKLLALDVDGVLTDNGLYYNDDGLYSKRFDCQDGVAVKLAQKADIQVAIITGMASEAVLRRAETLGITDVYCGAFNKVRCIRELKDKYRLEWPQIAYIGDDWVDLPVMSAVGLALAVRDAQPEVRGFAHYVSRYGGGRGAVRDLVRHILAAQDKLEELLRIWLKKKLS
jgi:3-deoxy-D-manno-octulosonate 8-phosphate phosphatase (KDO 8-P phosphatase)